MSKPSLKQILEWCDKQASKGHTLTLKWEGGNDSGWVYFEIDDETCNTSETEALVDMMYEKLDYGSWAGEFNATGVATYDPKTRTFTGEDYYSYTESTSAECNIEIRIPKWLPFDAVNINTQDENIDVEVRIILSNGFMHPQTKDVETKLEEVLHPLFDDAINDALKANSEEYDDCWHNYQLTKREHFKLDGEHYVAVINEVHYNIHEGEDKTVEINLAELLEEKETV